MRTIIFIFLFPAFLLAQDYYEASGRTAVFTLKAGSTAQPISVKTATISRSQTVFRFTVAGNTIHVNPSRAGILKLYTLSGRILNVYAVNSSGTITLKRSLENGVHLLRFESEGTPVKAAKLVVTGRGLR